MRAPHDHELETLQTIERAAGALFAEIGMENVANDEPFSLDELAAYVRDGHAWVIAVDGEPVGYALVEVLDGQAHLEQLSVDPQQGRRGYGGTLLEHVVAWAGDNGFAAMTLTTFEAVEWNAPYYARHGFRVLEEPEIGPELRQRVEEEALDGLDPLLRVCMRRDV